VYIHGFCFFGKSEYEKKVIDCPFSDRTKKETPMVFLETKKSSHDKTANIGGDSAVCVRNFRVIFNPKIGYFRVRRARRVRRRVGSQDASERTKTICTRYIIVACVRLFRVVFFRIRYSARTVLARQTSFPPPVIIDSCPAHTIVRGAGGGPPGDLPPPTVARTANTPVGYGTMGGVIFEKSTIIITQ